MDNRQKLKKINFFMIIMLFLFLMTGCTTLKGLFEKETNNDVTKDVEMISLEEESNQYDKSVRRFIPVEAKNVLNEVIHKPALLYIGRKTCPYCREFVEKLTNIVKTKKVEVQYLDSENVSSDNQIQEVRKKYGLETVPTLIFIKMDGNFVKYDSEENLNDWLNKNGVN